MKIAFVHQPIDAAILPVESGSIAIWTDEVARRLAQSCEVIVYARKSPSQQKVEWDEGVQYRRVSVSTDRILRGLLKLFSRVDNVKRPSFASIWYHLGYALKVAKDLRVEKCDLVHIHQFSQFVPIIRAFNPKIKIVLHMHGEWLTQIDHKMIEKRIRKANLVFGCSEYITEGIRRTFPQFAKSCKTIINGVDVHHFVIKTDLTEPKIKKTKNLLFVGRVSPEKGVHILLDAFKNVLGHHPDAQLKIVGPQVSAPLEFILPFNKDSKFKDLASLYSGSYRSRLRDQLPSNVASQVSFIGNVPHSQVINYFQDADVFIFPSVWDEPFGIPIVEAMATGVPVVATRVGGITEIVEDGKTGLFVERGEVTALADAIISLLSDKDRRKSMGKAGRQRAIELFSWERIVENLLYQYKNSCDSYEEVTPSSPVTTSL